MEFTKTEQALYYGFSVCIFSTAGYLLSGGAFNLSFIIGGMIFNRVINSTIIAMFMGSILGCITARVFYDQFLERKKAKSTSQDKVPIAASNVSKSKVD